MRKLIHFVHSSADGFIEGPDGEFDWPTMGPELSAYSLALSERAGAFVYGRLVWEMMSGFWPSAESMSDDPHDLAFAPVWRSTPKVVLSRTLPSADWNTQVVDVDGLAALKAADGGDLLLTGGSSAPAALTARGLIDEYHVVVHPVLLGGGKPVFAPDKQRVPLRVVESRVFDGGAVLVRYARR